MRYFVITDIHGFYDEMIETLNKFGYDKDNPEHFLISLGDLFDRGPKNYEVLEFINSIPNDRKCLIAGNHDYYAQDAEIRKYLKGYDKHNGLDKTLDQFYFSCHDEDYENIYEAFDWLAEWEPYKKYKDNLVWYAVLGDKVFVHGWIPYWCQSIDDLSLTAWGDWYDYSWDNGMQCWHDYGPLKITKKKDSALATVFCGHYHASFGNSRYHHDGLEYKTDIQNENDYVNNNPFIDNGIICLDARTYDSGQVNCYVFEDNENELIYKEVI